MTIDSLFNGFGATLAATLIISVIGVLLSPYPIFNLTIEEKTIVNLNIKVLRVVVKEIGVFLMILIVTSALWNIEIANHEIISSYPFISNYSPSGFLIILLGILMVIFVSLLLFIRLYKKFRVFIFTKLRMISTARRSVKIMSAIIFVLFVYTYVIPPIYFLGYISNFLLLALGQSYKVHAENTSEIFFRLFTVVPQAAYIVYIFCYLAMYFFVRLIFSQLFIVGNLFAYSKVIANVTLVNGEKLLNKLIIRPSIDGSLLLKDAEGAEKKILLPKTSILYIEFDVKHVTIQT